MNVFVGLYMRADQTVLSPQKEHVHGLSKVETVNSDQTRFSLRVVYPPGVGILVSSVLGFSTFFFSPFASIVEHAIVYHLAADMQF